MTQGRSGEHGKQLHTSSSCFFTSTSCGSSRSDTFTCCVGAAVDVEGVDIVVRWCVALLVIPHSACLPFSRSRYPSRLFATMVTSHAPNPPQDIGASSTLHTRDSAVLANHTVLFAVAIFHASFHPTRGNIIDWSLKAADGIPSHHTMAFKYANPMHYAT